MNLTLWGYDECCREVYLPTWAAGEPTPRWIPEASAELLILVSMVEDGTKYVDLVVAQRAAKG